MKGHYPNLGRKPPEGDSPGRHPSSHHSDHSGAHVRGTHHHLSHAHHTNDGTESEDHELKMGEHHPDPSRDLQRKSHGADIDLSQSMPGGAMSATVGPEDEEEMGENE